MTGNFQTVVHAPSVISDRYAYCVDLGIPGLTIAKKNKKVSCRKCLIRLKKNAQYANFLYVNKKINALGI